MRWKGEGGWWHDCVIQKKEHLLPIAFPDERKPSQAPPVVCDPLFFIGKEGPSVTQRVLIGTPAAPSDPPGLGIRAIPPGHLPDRVDRVRVPLEGGQRGPVVVQGAQVPHLVVDRGRALPDAHQELGKCLHAPWAQQHLQRERRVLRFVYPHESKELPVGAQMVGTRLLYLFSIGRNRRKQKGGGERM